MLGLGLGLSLEYALPGTCTSPMAKPKLPVCCVRARVTTKDAILTTPSPTPSISCVASEWVRGWVGGWVGGCAGGWVKE